MFYMTYARPNCEHMWKEWSSFKHKVRFVEVLCKMLTKTHNSNNESFVLFNLYFPSWRRLWSHAQSFNLGGVQLQALVYMMAKTCGWGSLSEQRVPPIYSLSSPSRVHILKSIHKGRSPTRSCIFCMFCQPKMTEKPEYKSGTVI